MRRLDWFVLILLIIGALGSKLTDFSDHIPDNANPRRPAVEHFTPELWDAQTRNWLAKSPAQQKGDLPWNSPLPKEGLIEDKVGKTSSTGSAFSVSKSGIWLTARHVAEGCDKTSIQVGERKGVRVKRTVLHPSADVAILITDGGTPEFPVVQAPQSASNAFNIGFPKGQPGAVHSRLIGEMTLRHVRRGQRGGGYRERVNAWAEQSRVPKRDGSLGGLSGGAVLNDKGQVIGIVQAESARRGRIMTARLATIHEIFSYANLNLPSATPHTQDPKLTKDNYPVTARKLITTLRIAKVICRVG